MEKGLLMELEASYSGWPTGFVSHGEDIPNADLLFKALVDAQTSVKLFYTCEDSIV